MLLEFPLEVNLAINAGAALAIDVAAKGEAHIEAVRSFEGYACGDAHAVAPIGFGFVGYSYARKVDELVADAVELLPEDCIIHRLTGDGPKKSLIAPLWSGNKKRVMADMQKALRQRGIVAYQEKEHHK